MWLSEVKLFDATGSRAGLLEYLKLLPVVGEPSLGGDFIDVGDVCFPHKVGLTETVRLRKRERAGPGAAETRPASILGTTCPGGKYQAKQRNVEVFKY